MITGYTAEGIGELSPPCRDPHACTCAICGEEFEGSFADVEICPECEEYFETLSEIAVLFTSRSVPKLERVIQLLNNSGPEYPHNCLGWIQNELRLWRLRI